MARMRFFRGDVQAPKPKVIKPPKIIKIDFPLPKGF